MPGCYATKAMKSILDPAFRYVPSHATDIRKTFERIRREQQAPARRLADTVVQLQRPSSLRT
jgi:uncharacterized protein (DUF2342 family)